MEELKKGLATLFQNDSTKNKNNTSCMKNEEIDYLNVLSCGCIPALHEIDPYHDESDSYYSESGHPLHMQDAEILDRMLSWLSRLSKKEEDDNDNISYYTESSFMRDDKNINLRQDEPSRCSDSRSQLSKASRVSFAFPPVTSVRSRPKTTSFENRYLYFSDEDNEDHFEAFDNPDRCEI